MTYQNRKLKGFVTILITLMLAALSVSAQNLKPRYFYALGQNSRLFINGITQKTGQLRSLGYVLVPSSGAVALAMDPSQRFVYVANSASNDVAAFTEFQERATDFHRAECTGWWRPKRHHRRPHRQVRLREVPGMATWGFWYRKALPRRAATLIGAESQGKWHGYVGDTNTGNFQEDL